MKLNYKRTVLVGFAFFAIMAFWQAYDTIVPLMLVNKFGMDQTWSGVIMALDNILAVFLLPLFGALSDKTHTRFGKRTPYIFIGTILAIVMFMGLTFADNAQLNKISQGNNEMYWEQNYVIDNSEYDSFGNNSVPKQYTVRDYAAKVLFGKQYDQLTSEQQQQAQQWYLEIDQNTAYVYDKANDSYTVNFEEGAKTTNAYTALVSSARSVYANQVTQGQVGILVIFIILLLATLISMAVFRSPAVALMPDVTIKPLRSKANAIINLMGTAGGMLVLVLGMLFGTGSVKNQIMSYTGYVAAVCGLMLAALIVFVFTVKERKWNGEMLIHQQQLDTEQQVDETQPTEEEADKTSVELAASKEKLPREKLSSLILILASVALWFIGYNAITSKYSLYAVNVLNKDFNATMLIAQGAAIIAYIPVGMLASKLGRKKTILIGIGLLTVAFASAYFVNSHTPDAIMWILFALAGIAWATINVNSFPMVVELSQGGSIGKYTGYYYTASMAAQIATPILSGALMDALGMSVLFPYGAIFVALSFVTMFFVKYGDSKPTAPKDKMEMLGGADD